jgi:NADPH:quinone reductase
VRGLTASPDGPVLTTGLTRPTPGQDDILVEVHAAALNRIDLAMSRGSVHGSAGGVGQICGLEWAGVVAAVGSDVTRWEIGDAVMGYGPGAFADFTTAPASSAVAIPPGLTMQEAAMLPVGIQTMHDALVGRGRFQTGQTVLVQGASSGMGIFGLQIARELGARTVIGTSTSDQRRARLTEFGADVAVDSARDGWVSEVLDATGGHGVDVAVDLVGGELVNDTIRATAMGGHVVNVGRVGGERTALDLDLHALRRITYVGTTFRTRTPEQTGAAIAAAHADLGAGIAARRIAAPLAAEFPIEESASAFAKMSSNEHFGKIVLDVR